MSTEILGATQECEDVAKRLYYVSQVVWHDGVLPKFTAWRAFRLSHPELSSGVVTDANRSAAQQDQALYVIFANAVADLCNSWLMPATIYAAGYRGLIGEWNGRRCLESSAVCVPPAEGEENAHVGDGSGAVQSLQCFSNEQIVQQIMDLTRIGYEKSLAMRTGPGSIYPAFPRIIPLPSPAIVQAWSEAFEGYMSVYYELWYSTYCGGPAPRPVPQIVGDPNSPPPDGDHTSHPSPPPRLS